MLLKYEKEILKETQQSSFILITAFGIELSNIIDINISLYLNKYSLVFLINFENTFEIKNEYFRSIKNLDKSARNKLYKKGGVFLCTNRILVTDFLEQNIELNTISSLIVKNADKIYEDSLDAFIIYIYKKYNKDGIIKAFSTNCIPFSHGVNCLEKFVKVLCANNLILYPRFHSHIESSFSKQIEYKEHRLAMTYEMVELQMILIEILKESIKMNNLDIDYELILISDMFLNNRIKDIFDLKKLINLLISCNQLTFFVELANLINYQIELGKESTWINSKYAQILLDKIDLFLLNNKKFIDCDNKEILEKIKTEKNLFKRYDVRKSEEMEIRDEHNCKKTTNSSDMINRESRKQNLEIVIKKNLLQNKLDSKNYNKKFIKLCEIINSSIDNVIFIVVNFAFTKKDVEEKFYDFYKSNSKNIFFLTRQEFLNFKIKFKNENILNKLNKFVNECKNVDEIYENSNQFFIKNPCNKNIITDGEKLINDYAECILNNEYLELNSKNSYLIILYDLDISILRKCEFIGTKFNITVESIMFKDSVEEQKYLNSIRREKRYFEQLIEKRRKLPLTLELDKITIEDDSSEENIKFNIIVDTRELRSQLPFYLYKSNNHLTISTLKIGDYLLNENICIERKNILDLIASIKTGRLYIQARMFTYFYNQHYILIEFNSRPCFSDFYNHSHETFKNSLISKFCLFLMTFPTTKLLWSENSLFSVKLFRRLQKKELIPEINVEIDPNLHEILLSIPGVNQFNINKIKKNFKNLKELVYSSQFELISKLGEDNGTKIYNFFNSKLEIIEDES